MTTILGALTNNDSASRVTDAMLRDTYLQGIARKYEPVPRLSFVTVDGNDRAILLQSESSILALFGTLFLPSGKLLSNDQIFTDEFLPQFTSEPNLFLCECTGAFVFAYADTGRNTYYLASDPFGNLPLFYAVTPEGLFFSTRQRPIASAIGAATDNASILQYASIGLSLGNATYYYGIQRVPTASIIMYKDTAKVTQYFIPSYSRSNDRDIAGVLNDLKNILLPSVQNELDSAAHSCVALTGGFDSRATLSLIYGSDRIKNQVFYTHGEGSSYDMSIAARITSSLGLKHQPFVFDDDIFSSGTEYFDDIIGRSEGTLGIEGVTTLAAWERQKDEFSTVFDSHGGQIYRRTILKARENSIRKMNDITGGIARYVTSTLMRSQWLLPDVKNEAQKITRKALSEYFSTLREDIDIADKIDRFFIDQLCNNKYSAAGDTQMSYIRFIHPLLNLKAAELLSRIPSRFRACNNVYDYLLRTLAPALTQFPLENNGYRVPYHGYRWKRYIPQVFDEVCAKIGITTSLQRPITSIDMIMRYGRKKAESMLSENSELIKNYVDINVLNRRITTMPNPELVALTNFALLMRYLSGK
ncbi:MAG TPA: hypothetical protein VEW28_05920 [Candidatus Kapabacteria bacterium]|nr:hypothetical protein [Candidatus Kapabacteria bacterium]